MASAAPICFVGSSSEGLAYADALREHLAAKAIQVEQWNLSTFALGQTTIEALEESIARCSFAVLIATGDDTTISRHEAKISPRDNVIFEFGLFAGRLGRQRAFLLVPEDVPDLRLPSDLLGVTVARFKLRNTPVGRRTAMTAAADQVIAAMRKLGVLSAPADPALANELLGSVSRQLTELAARGGSKMRPARRDEWIQSVLTAVLDPFLARIEDAYAVWLVPGEDAKLDVAASSNLPLDYDHYRWARSEGLVGRVWDTGGSAATSSLQRHSWFEIRPGCENQAYVCSAVGAAAGPSGVLAVGSDDGFPVHQGDEGLVRAYAAILSIVDPDTGMASAVIARSANFARSALGRLPGLPRL